MVGAGDEVEIELWAEWSPPGDGFAWSWFSISVGDQFFETAASVNINEEDGYGRNPALSFDPGGNGESIDSDSSGEYDLIDWIDVYQLPRIYGIFDNSNPIRVYSLLWTIGSPVDLPVTVARADVFANGQQRFQRVWLDEWGSVAEYDQTEDLLVFIPGPASALPLLYLLLLSRERCS